MKGGGHKMLKSIFVEYIKENKLNKESVIEIYIEEEYKTKPKSVRLTQTFIAEHMPQITELYNQSRADKFNFGKRGEKEKSVEDVLFELKFSLNEMFLGNIEPDVTAWD